MNATKEFLGPGSPGEDCPLGLHFEAKFAAAEDVEDVEVLVVGTADDFDILHCSQTVVPEVDDPLQVPSVTGVAEEEQQAPEIVGRIENLFYRIPEAKVVAVGALRF